MFGRCGTWHLLNEVITVDHYVWHPPNQYIQALGIGNDSNAPGWRTSDAWPSLHHWTLGQLASSVWAQPCSKVSQSCCHTAKIRGSLVAYTYILGIRQACGFGSLHKERHHWPNPLQSCLMTASFQSLIEFSPFCSIVFFTKVPAAPLHLPLFYKLRTGSVSTLQFRVAQSDAISKMKFRGHATTTSPSLWDATEPQFSNSTWATG